MYLRSLYYKDPFYVQYIKWTLIESLTLRLYKGPLYVLSFQANQPGADPSHAHVHKMDPYRVTYPKTL